MKLLERSMTRVFMLGIVVVLLIVSSGLLFFGLYYDTPSLSLSNFSVGRIQIIYESNGSISTGLVYIASTKAEQVQGFQNATSFGSCNGFSKNESTSCLGMIFVTTSTQDLCFWMHDTPLPLQQVWISSNGTVTYTYEAQPESLNTICHNAIDVLETGPSIPISIGDKIVFQAGIN